MSAHESLGRHANPIPFQHRLLAVVVAAQAGWIIYLCSRGWFYRGDFTLLSQAGNHRLTFGYLTHPFNGHLAPGVRVTFWILARTSRLHYGPTILLRVVLQVIATLLLFRLLSGVSRSRTLALVVTTIYCACPLLVPGTLSLASSINLLPAQICVLIAYLAHLRRAETGALRWSLVAGLAIVVGAGFWEKTAVTALMLVILSLGWLSSGSLRHRLMGLAREWRSWLLTLAPLTAFTVYFFIRGYGPTTADLPPGAGLHLIWLQWSHSLWPAVIGAPWHWSFSAQSYTAVADPRLGTVIAGQCAFGLLVVAGWRRTRWRSLLAWSLPLVTVVAGELLTGFSRYTSLGTLPALTFSYAFDLAIPTALAIALAFARSPRTGPESIATVTIDPTQVLVAQVEVAPARPGRWRRRLRASAAVLACGLVVASAAGSAVAWTDRWHDSPAKSYVNALVSGIAQIGPSANLYDTDVSPRVLPVGTRNRHLSDLLSLTGARLVYDGGLPQPQIVTGSGQIVPAVFHPLAHQVVRPNTFCPTLIKGATTVTIPLKPQIARGAYFLRIAYFEQRLALVTVTVRDADGRAVPLRVDPTEDFDQQLGVMLLPLTPGRPAKVTFSSNSEAANVCMSKVSVGAPGPAQP